jgi:hypothetical protein
MKVIKHKRINQSCFHPLPRQPQSPSFPRPLQQTHKPQNPKTAPPTTPSTGLKNSGAVFPDTVAPTVSVVVKDAGDAVFELSLAILIAESTTGLRCEVALPATLEARFWAEEVMEATSWEAEEAIDAASDV